MGKRVHLWDNFKALLIFFIVLGHYILPYRHDTRVYQYLFFLIYFFHVPMFVFTTGYFSKSYINKLKEGNHTSVLSGYLLLYLTFSLLQSIIPYLYGNRVIINFLNAGSAQWYLLCVLFWYLLLPFFSERRPFVGIIISILVSLLSGINNHFGDFLALSRTIVFLPFFVLGYYLEEKHIMLIRSIKRGKVIAIVLLIIVCLGVYSQLDNVMTNSYILYGNTGYQVEGVSLERITYRLGWIMINYVLLFIPIVLLPNKKTIVSSIGTGTLSIYILHILFRNIMIGCGIYDKFSCSNSTVVLLSILLISILSCVLFSNQKINNMFRMFFCMNDIINSFSNSHKNKS